MMRINGKPDILIFHVGSNDLTKNVDTIPNLQTIVDRCKRKSAYTKIVISSVVTRKDYRNSETDVIELNDKLKSFCDENKIDYLNNDNIDESCLGKKFLHPNKKGKSYLAKNFINYIKSCKWGVCKAKLADESTNIDKLALLGTHEVENKYFNPTLFWGLTQDISAKTSLKTSPLHRNVNYKTVKNISDTSFYPPNNDYIQVNKITNRRRAKSSEPEIPGTNKCTNMYNYMIPSLNLNPNDSGNARSPLNPNALSFLSSGESFIHLGNTRINGNSATLKPNVADFIPLENTHITGNGTHINGNNS